MNRARLGIFLFAMVLLCGCGGKELRRKTLLPAPTIDFTFTPVDGEIAVTGYRGTEQELLLPDMVNLVLPIAIIGEQAFYDNDTLTYVCLPESVKSIGSEAFGSCDAIEEIVIPKTVISIDENAFAGCNAVLVVEENSYAHTYAKENDMNYRLK